MVVVQVSNYAKGGVARHTELGGWTGPPSEFNEGLRFFILNSS